MNITGFLEAYNLIQHWDHGTLVDQLRKLGRWPANRIALRVLPWEEASRRLADDTNAALCEAKAVVAIEDVEGRLYLCRSTDLVTGTRGVHRQMLGGQQVDATLGEAFKKGKIIQ